MPGKVNIYNLGTLGVDLTKSPFHKDDGSLVSAQNAVPDIRDEAGGLTKRDGLVAVNSSALAGTVQGALHVALTDQSGNTGARYIYVGIRTESSSTDIGWYRSLDQFVSVATQDTIPTAGNLTRVDDIHSLGATPPQALGFTTAVAIKNKLYYAFGAYTQFSSAPSIRVYDGLVDKEVLRIPVNPDVYPTQTVPRTIMTMLAIGDTIYLSVWDNGTTTDLLGSVFSFHTVTGHLTKLGATFATGRLPIVLGWSLGRLWVGSYANDNPSIAAKIYFIRPSIDTAWTDDETFPSNLNRVGDIIDFRGTLYASLYGNGSGGGTPAIYARSPADGSWASSDTNASPFAAMIVFNDALYAVTYSGVLRKYDGTSWSTVSAGFGSQMIGLLSDNGTLYAFRGNGQDIVYVSTDGATWSAAREVTSSSTLTLYRNNVALSL